MPTILTSKPKPAPAGATYKDLKKVPAAGRAFLKSGCTYCPEGERKPFGGILGAASHVRTAHPAKLAAWRKAHVSLASQGYRVGKPSGGPRTASERAHDLAKHGKFPAALASSNGHGRSVPMLALLTEYATVHARLLELHKAIRRAAVAEGAALAARSKKILALAKG